MKDAENGKEPDLIPLASLTSETAKSVKALLAAGTTLKLKESSLTQQLQTRMRALHVRSQTFKFSRYKMLPTDTDRELTCAQTAQKLKLNESAKENALVMKAMLQANSTGDREQFLQLGRCMAPAFTVL